MSSSALPKSSSAVNYCISQIQQISDKLDKYEEGVLEGLDTCISNYVERRNQMKKPVLESLEEDSLSIENLNMSNLNVLHNASEAAYLQLQLSMEEFNKQKQQIQEANNRCLPEFITQEQAGENISLISITKDVITELSKYRNVEDFVMKIQQGKRKNKNFARDQDILVEVEEFLLKTDQLLEDDDLWDVPHNISESSQSAMMLEYLS